MKFSLASSCVRWLRTSPDDVDTGGPRNVSWLAIQLPDAAATPPPSTKYIYIFNLVAMKALNYISKSPLCYMFPPR